MNNFAHCLITSEFSICLRPEASCNSHVLYFITVDGAQDWKKKQHRLFRDLSVAAAVLVSCASITNTDLDDSTEQTTREPFTDASSEEPAITQTDSTDGRDTVGSQALSRHRRGLQRTKSELHINKEGRYASRSQLYFEALFWGIFLSRLWLYLELFLILLIPVMFYVLKQLLSLWSLSVSSSTLYMILIQLWAKVKSWANDRKQALVPTQLSGLLKGGINVDRMVSSSYEAVFFSWCVSLLTSGNLMTNFCAISFRSSMMAPI